MTTKKRLWKTRLVAFCASATASGVLTFIALTIPSPTLTSQVVPATEQTVDEAAEQRALDALFIDRDLQEHRRDESLRRVKDALFMLGKVNRSALAASTVALVDETTLKLQDALPRIANPESETSWKSAVTNAQRAIQAVQGAIAADERGVAPSTVQAEEGARAILARLNGIVAKMPAATQALDTHGVAIPTEARVAYEDAARETLAAVQECPAMRACRHVPLAVTAIEQWKDAVQNAVDQADKPALLEEIERIVAQ